MANYKMVLQYEGTRYRGWQRQESTDNTIQGKLESILTKMCGYPIEIQGAGRTDAGVHARGQVANFHIEEEQSAEQIMNYVNQYLPEDIAVISMEQVPERFHSRLNAKGKTYCYQIIQSPIPHVFERRYAHRIEKRLNVEEMRRAAEFLTGKHDFASFTSTKKSKKSTVRTIEKIELEETGDMLRIKYSGDGFLYHMVRILTGTLIEVGTGERRAEDICAILEAGKRECAGHLAPAVGLTLMEVRY